MSENINIPQKIESTPPIGQRGTIISYIVLILSIAAAILYQHYFSERIPASGWTEGCPVGFESRCKSNGASLRVSFALSVIFIIQGVASFISTDNFDRYWGVKLPFYIGLLVGFYFVKASVFDTNGYAWFARIVAGVFVVFQQIIILDAAYIWNERWVNTSEEGSSLWLGGLLICSILCLGGSVSVIGILYWQFGGCPETIAIITIVLVLGVIATLIQLFGSSQGSLLTSAFIVAYTTFLCYSSVSLNPYSSCNPTIATSYQTLTEALGIVITVLSLTWTIVSAVNKLGHALGVAESSAEGSIGHIQRVNLVFILVSSYFAMVLTDWATIQAGSASADKKAGEVAMWIQAGGAWLASLLYIWSLIAPILFPDREFS